MQIEKQIIIPTAPQKVLEAFMQSRHTMEWWGQCESFFDLQHKTFSWRWHNGEKGMMYLTHGRILDYASGVFLHLHDIWQYAFDKPQPTGPVSLLLEVTPQVNDTLLILKHDGFVAGDSIWEQYAKAVSEGWDSMLPQLKNYLEQ